MSKNPSSFGGLGDEIKRRAKKKYGVRAWVQALAAETGVNKNTIQTALNRTEDIRLVLYDAFESALGPLRQHPERRAEISVFLHILGTYLDACPEQVPRFEQMFMLLRTTTANESPSGGGARTAAGGSGAGTPSGTRR